MGDRTLRIPRFLHELHGEETSLPALACTYSAAVAAGAAAWVGLAPARPLWWRLAIAVLVFADVGGGVVANFSAGTMRYYRERPRLRVFFLLAHLVQPALLTLAFPAASPAFIFAGLFTVGSGLAVTAIRDVEAQQSVAALLATVGTLGAALIGAAFIAAAPPILLAFAPLFMLKIIVGFSVRRPLPGEALSPGQKSA